MSDNKNPSKTYEGRFVFEAERVSHSARVSHIVRENRRKKKWQRLETLRTRKSVQFPWRLKTPPPDSQGRSQTDKTPVYSPQCHDHIMDRVSSGLEASRSFMAAETVLSVNLSERSELFSSSANVEPRGPLTLPVSPIILVVDETPNIDLNNSDGKYWYYSLNEFPKSLKLMMARPTSMDPFGCFPMPLNHAGAAALHQYVNVCPEALWQVSSKTPFIMIRDVFFPVLARDPAGLYQMMAYVSVYSDKFTKTKESVTTTRYERAGLSAIRKAIGNGKTDGKLNALAAISAALIIEQAKNGPSVMCRIHSLGISQILRSVGGFEALRNEPQADILITYTQVLCTKSRFGTWENGPPPGFEAEHKSELREFNYDCRCLMKILKDFKMWHQEFKHSEPPIIPDDRRTRTFGKDSLIHNALEHSALLQGGPYPQLTTEEESIQLFAYFYLAYAMWEYRDSPTLRAAFIDNLNALIQWQGIANTYSCVTFVWLLFRDIDDRPERKWLSARMVNALFRLSQTTKQKTLNLFRSLLDPALQYDPIISEADRKHIGVEAVLNLKAI